MRAGSGEPCAVAQAQRRISLSGKAGDAPAGVAGGGRRASAFHAIEDIHMPAGASKKIGVFYSGIGDRGRIGPLAASSTTTATKPTPRTIHTSLGVEPESRSFSCISAVFWPLR